MDKNRHQADSGAEYSLYLDLLGDKITQYNIDTRHTYNMNGKGFLIGITGRSKRVFSKGRGRGRKSGLLFKMTPASGLPS
jgi:hypothetical protein